MRIALLPALLAFSFSFIAPKEPGKLKLTAPPGTVLLREGLYIDKYEVSVRDWKEYLEGWVLGIDNDSVQYKKMLPDSLVWASLKFNSDQYIESYYKGNNYNNYPVVGISYEQARVFCEWRTERVNELLEKSPNALFRKVEYRLPTEKEWELAAAGTLDTAKFPYGYEITRRKVKGEIVKIFNCDYTTGDSVNIIQNNVLPVDFSIPNQYGAYNMIGNVGEMTAEKGIAKGGHYDLPIEYCKVKEAMSYTAPNRWLGFRCVCQVIDANPFHSKEKKEKLKKGKRKNS